jgi:hypothetical protein
MEGVVLPLLLALATALAGGALAVAVVALRTARRAAAAAAERVEGPDARPAAREEGAAELAAARALEVAQSVARRLDLQEQRAVQPVLPEPVYPRDALGRVRAHVEALGYREVVVLPTDASGRRFLVEGRRDGMTSKGRAELEAEGDVVLAFATASRAFP